MGNYVLNYSDFRFNHGLINADLFVDDIASLNDQMKRSENIKTSSVKVSI